MLSSLVRPTSSSKGSVKIIKTVDGLKLYPTIKEASHLIKPVKEMCSSVGFYLYKFISNKKLSRASLNLTEQKDHDKITTGKRSRCALVYSV